jgi:hypothetical protein
MFLQPVAKFKCGKVLLPKLKRTPMDQKEKMSSDRHNQTPSTTPTKPLWSPRLEKDPGADMEVLLQRLRLHRAAPSPYDPAPAVTLAPTTTGGGELFRPRRAAVLVCLFRDAAGELRVILTKRAYTHSGRHMWLARFLRWCSCPAYFPPSLWTI